MTVVLRILSPVTVTFIAMCLLSIQLKSIDLQKVTTKGRIDILPADTVGMFTILRVPGRNRAKLPIFVISLIP
jgi:hypothetical protein